MAFLGLEGPAPFVVDQGGNRIGKAAGRIVLRRGAQRLEMQAPARAQTAQGVVELGAGGDQAGVGGAGQIGPAKGKSLLETAVLVEDEPGADQRHPGQVIEQALGLGAVLAKIQHGPGPSRPPARRADGEGERRRVEAAGQGMGNRAHGQASQYGFWRMCRLRASKK
jgi:hypothetical protein